MIGAGQGTLEIVIGQSNSPNSGLLSHVQPACKVSVRHRLIGNTLLSSCDVSFGDDHRPSVVARSFFIRWERKPDRGSLSKTFKNVPNERIVSSNDTDAYVANEKRKRTVAPCVRSFDGGCRARRREKRQEEEKERKKRINRTVATSESPPSSFIFGRRNETSSLIRTGTNVQRVSFRAEKSKGEYWRKDFWKGKETGGRINKRVDR